MFDRKTYSRDYSSKKRNQRKAEGRCVTCGATLTAECTTLQCERCREKQKYAMVAKVNIQKLIAEAKTDTVRKMQSEIKKTLSAICKGEMDDLFRIIDQIAEEMEESGYE